MSSGSKSGRNENNLMVTDPATTPSAKLLDDISLGNNDRAISNDIPDKPLTPTSDLSSWMSKSQKEQDNCIKQPNTLDSQRQRLNLLVELISKQDANLNRLKTLRNLSKEQAAKNVELSSELKTVNNSITEKDEELRIQLNRVDNLNRQLNNYRRLKSNRSKSITPVKQEDGHNIEDISAEQHKNTTAALSLSSCPEVNSNSNVNDGDADSNDYGQTSLSKEFATNSIQDQQDLTKTKLVSNIISDRDESKQITNSSLATDTDRRVASHNYGSPALTKYTNARQKLIGSGFKDKSSSRRVSFDPLALLLDAALEGELDLVIQTSKQVPDLSASHDECVTALHNAVVAGHYEVAKFLIEAGCDINTQDSDGWTPLHCAASCNNLPLVKLLVENGALIYATTTSDHSTPAMKCEQSDEGFEECYKYLMSLQNNLGVINNGLVYALYDYEAQEPDELSFKTDDELLILRRDDSQEQEWWWAQKRIKETSDSVIEIKEGYIPRNLVGLYPRVKAFKRSGASDATSKNGHGSLE